MSIVAGVETKGSEHFKIEIGQLDKSQKNNVLIFTGYYVEGEPFPKLVDVGFSKLVQGHDSRL